MIDQPKPASYEFVPLPSTYRVLPDALLELKTFSFWCIPGAEKEKQPGHWNGSKWVFTDWQKVENLEWIGDAVRLSHDMEVNVGLVVPEYWMVADFDQCRDPVSGDIRPTVQRIIERLKTVVLVSSSGTGLHVFLKHTPNQPLPHESKFTNPDLYLDIFKDKKKGELKKPGTFVAINWHPLPGYNALDKTVQHFPDWLMPMLFSTERTALEAPRERAVDTAVETHSCTLYDGAVRISEQFFKGCTNGGYTWRLLRFNENQTMPFKKQPHKIADRSQWIILVLGDYFQHVPDANNEDAIKLSEAYDIHWLKHSPHEFANKLPHNDLWHKNQVLKQRDVADAKMRSERTDINHPVSVTNAIWKIVQESANPLLTSNEKLILGAIAQQIQQQSDLSVKISNKDMLRLTRLGKTTLKEPKRRLVGRNLPWLEITTASRTTIYRIVLSR